jgi:molybdenum cofactor synthesis domain-containing protein
MSRSAKTPSLHGAQRTVCSGLRVVASEAVELLDSLHRVIRRDTVSRRDYPSADCAARDGYCIRAAATAGASARNPAVLRLRGTIRSGDAPGTGIAGEDCMLIMTGGTLPAGADAVVPVEQVGVEAGYVRVPCPIEMGSHIRKTGEAVKAGETVAGQGDFVSPGLLGLLGAVGVRKLRVSRRVRMGIVTTGNEMVEAGGRPRSWQVHDSNSVMLAGLGRELGCQAVRLGIARDTQGEIVRLLRSAGACDLVLLTGGSSQGIMDLVPAALGNHGCRIIMRGIRLRPGRHVVFARKGRQIFFGLPGRPGGCFGLFHVLVKPAIMAMMGCRAPVPVGLKATWGGGLIESPPVDTLLAARMGSGRRVLPAGGSGCGDLAAIARADCLVLLKAGARPVRRGDTLSVFPVAPPWSCSGRSGEGGTSILQH